MKQEDHEGAACLLELLRKQIVRKREKEEEEEGVEGYPSESDSSVIRGEEETSVEKGAELNKLEMELQRGEEIRQLHEQDCLLQQVIILK